jgi:hypothetical protein
MKKLLVFLGVLALIVPFAAHGAEIKFGKEPYFLNKGETVNQNLYFAGQGADIAGDVQGDVVAVGSVIGVKGNVSGDVVAAGGRVSVSGNVSGSVFAGGGTVDVSGNVGGSVRTGGGTVTVSGIIEKDLVVGGGQIIVMPDAIIRGDLILGGGTADIQGKVLGNVRSGARQLTINNQIGGKTDLNVENLSLGPKAVLSQGLTYHSYAEAKIDPAAKITGAVNFDQKQGAPRGSKTFMPAIFGVGMLFKFLMFLAAGLVFAYFFKKSTASIVHGSMANWKVLWKGFAFLILTPILAIILMVTVIGIPLGILALLVYAFTLLITCVLAEIAAGAWLQKWIWKKDTVDWKTVLLGTLAFIVLGWIPIVGWLATFALFLSAIGSFTHYFRESWAKEL